ncbi:MAG: hypothetical protein D6762_00485 [Candidatus Neomarinimicrobiota bacterium]|nr:MAG: hypothetical protein D6762_00485 [Candidatus Neomarinimicrobiota bacterium]
MKSLLTCLLLIHLLPGQSLNTIRAVELSPKVNGYFIRLTLSRPIQSQDLAGWQADNQWFYLTLFQCQADTTSLLRSFQPTREIDRLDIVNSSESAQLAFRLHTQIDDFDLLPEPQSPVLNVALRFQRGDLLAALEQEKASPVQTPKSPSSETVVSPLYLRVRSVSYLTGVSLTIAGILASDNAPGVSWELPTGVSILGLTYIYDHFIHRSPARD